MALSQKELVKRADLAISDLTSNGGMLNPEQANMFIDMVQETPTILNQARVVPMNAPSMNINRLGFGSRIMRAAPWGTSPYAADDGSNDRYLAAADRSSPETAQIQLNTVEAMAEVHLPYETLEDNIEGQSFEQHVMRLIAEKSAEDLEELALEGDTAHATDTYLQLLDGLLKTATTNVVANASAGISPDMFQAGLLAMPQKYLRNRSALRNFVPIAEEINYRANVATRATGYGDSALQQDGTLVAYGVPVEGAPLMPASTGLLTYPQNILFGIQRQIQIETEKDIRARALVIVLTTRIDVRWDLEEAVVKYTGI